MVILQLRWLILGYSLVAMVDIREFLRLILGCFSVAMVDIIGDNSVAMVDVG